MEQPSTYLSAIVRDVYLAVETELLEKFPRHLNRIFYDGVRCEACPPENNQPVGVVVLDVPIRRDIFSPGEAVSVIQSVAGIALGAVRSIPPEKECSVGRIDYSLFLRKEGKGDGIFVSIYQPPLDVGELSDLMRSEQRKSSDYMTVRVRLDFKAVPRDVEKILIKQYVRGGEERVSAQRTFENRIKGRMVDSKRLEWLCEDGLDGVFLRELILDGSPLKVEEVMEMLKDYKP